MSKLESIEKLRKYELFDRGIQVSAYMPSDELADEIQTEVDERYMKLPVDADGVPIRPGDCVCGLKGENADARFITIHCDGTYDVGSRGWQPHYLRHVKPRTVEDVLREYGDAVDRLGQANVDVTTYAAELQMRGDAE